MATPYTTKRSGYTYKYAEFANSNKNFRIYLAYKTSQNTTDNTTTISMEMGLYSVTVYAQETYSSGGSLKCQMIVGSSTYGVTGSGYDLTTHGTGYHFPSLSYSKTFIHDGDGTHDPIKLYAYCNTVTGQGSSSITVTYTPTTISRESGLSVATSATMGGNLKLTISRNSSSFRHTLTYACGAVSGTIVAKSSTATSYTWTIPTSLAKQCTSANSVTCKFYLKTYGSSTSTTQIGRTITKSVKLNVPSGNPTISSVTITPNTDYTSAFGCKYVQNRSNAAITVAAEAKYYATIKSYKITANGASSTTNKLNTGTLKKAGETYPIRIEVTDSRGRTTVNTSHAVASDIGTDSVCAYSPPVISSFSVKRCTAVSNGSGYDITPDDSGEYACVSYNTSITNVTSENASYNTYVNRVLKLPNGLGEIALTNPSESNLLIATESGPVSFNTEIQHNISLEVTDYFYQSTNCIKKDAILGTVFVLIDLNSEGNGLAIGKVSENASQLDVNISSLFRENINLTNTHGIRIPLSDGTDTNLITRNSSNNVWIGDAVGESQGNVYLSTKTGGYALVCRNQVRTKILDYSFVFQQLFSGSFSSGSITVSGMSKYHIYLIYFDGDNTPLLALRRGGNIRGIGGFSSDSNNPWINVLGLTLSGDTLTYGSASNFYISSTTKAVGNMYSGKAIDSIYGLLGTEANV